MSGSTSGSTSGLTAETDPALRGLRKRAVLSAWAGFAVDSYSIYIASSVLLPALVYFQGDMSVEAKSIFAGMTLAVTLLGRPLGGLIFGHSRTGSGAGASEPSRSTGSGRSRCSSPACRAPS